MELKEIVKNHLVEEKETARLERIEQNKKLKEVTIFTSKNMKMCEESIKTLKNEGIKFKEIKIEGSDEKWDKVVYTTNMSLFPTIVVDNNYLVFQRDFKNTNQLVQLIQYYAKPSLKSEVDNIKLFETLKTQTYHLHHQIAQLENKLNPVMKFLTDLKNQLTEEDSE